MIAVSLAAIVAFTYGNQIIEVLLLPFPEDVEVVQLRVLEGVSVRMKIALWGGFIIAFPVVLYQVVMFARPALLPSERRFFYFALPVVGLLFLMGIGFSFIVQIPVVMGYLPTFLGDRVTPQISVESIIGTTVWLTLCMGLIFEMPVIMFLLARIGILNPRLLARQRRVAILVSFVAAAIITPTGDPITMTLFGLPIWILYEMGILFAKVAWWSRERRLRRDSSQGS